MMSLRLVGQQNLSDACYSLCYSPHVTSQLAVVSCENFGIRGRSHLHVWSNGELLSFIWSDAQYDLSFVETNPSLIVTASADGSILVWHLDSLERVPIAQSHEHQREIWCVHWSESRSMDSLLSTSADGTIKLWNFTSSPTVERTLTGHKSVVYEARWHPRRPGLIGSVSADSSLCLFDLKQSSPLINARAHPTEILSIDWSKYDDHVLITGACDNTVRLWDIRMIDKAIACFSGHQGAVRRVRFDPHRRDRLASVGYDGQMRVWSLTSNYNAINVQMEQISTDFVYGLDWALFERDKLAVGSWNRSVRFYESSLF